MDDCPFGSSSGKGEQVDMGAMITDARFARLEELIADAVCLPRRKTARWRQAIPPSPLAKGSLLHPDAAHRCDTPRMAIAQEGAVSRPSSSSSPSKRA